ncbi:MAG: DUF3316 domain-containing protein [Dysgonamonadaceae bacterium]|jgi:hypothetical protein|nr:DUF3316 domain-containing protein [Dysgonamonadaceae bacterium]
MTSALGVLSEVTLKRINVNEKHSDLTGKIIRRITRCLLLITVSISASAHDPPARLTYESMMAGIGTSSIYDTYLSPLQYGGINLSLTSELMKTLSIAGGKVISQQQIDISFRQAGNRTATAVSRAGMLQYNYGLFYRFKPYRRLRLYLGAQPEILLGFIHNNRNTNNPVTGKFHAGINLSAITSVIIPVETCPIRFSLQVSAPMTGIMYSPEYGQSYYEIGIGDNNNLIYFSTPQNYINLKGMITIEVPAGNTTFRFGYLHSLYQTKINSLQTQIRTNTFYVGLSKNILMVPGRKLNKYQHVFQ